MIHGYGKLLEMRKPTSFPDSRGEKPAMCVSCFSKIKAIKRLEQSLRYIAAGACGCGVENDVATEELVFSEWNYQRFIAAVKAIWGYEHHGEPIADLAAAIWEQQYE